MFSSHQIDDYLYQISDHHQDFQPQNLTKSGETFMIDENNLTQRTKNAKQVENPAPSNNDDDAKKTMRKENERKRRRQMAKLYEQLGSLLPPESIKGKRAASDQMNEVVNYITYMEKRVGELSGERDKLKKLCGSSRSTGPCSSSSSSSSCVAVHAFRDVVEIVISCGFGDESRYLSEMMQIILEEGLDIVRCVSSKTIEGFLHTIQATDPTQIDLFHLQTKLNDLVSY